MHVTTRSVVGTRPDSGSVGLHDYIFACREKKGKQTDTHKMILARMRLGHFLVKQYVISTQWCIYDPKTKHFCWPTSHCFSLFMLYFFFQTTTVDIGHFDATSMLEFNYLKSILLSCREGHLLSSLEIMPLETHEETKEGLQMIRQTRTVCNKAIRYLAAG